MAKRDTGVNSKKKSHPRKTQKRLAVKRERLLELMNKNRGHNRRVRSVLAK